jgi:hypothetical protein
MKTRFNSEAEALATADGFHGKGDRGIVGYLGFEAANYLVMTGNWMWLNVHCWGYILERRQTKEKG